VWAGVIPLRLAASTPESDSDGLPLPPYLRE
jgi:hypothetical protein